MHCSRAKFPCLGDRIRNGITPWLGSTVIVLAALSSCHEGGSGGTSRTGGATTSGGSGGTGGAQGGSASGGTGGSTSSSRRTASGGTIASGGTGGPGGTTASDGGLDSAADRPTDLARIGSPDTVDGNGRTADVGRDSNVRADVPGNVTLKSGEMVGRPTDHSVTIKAIAEKAAEAYIDYGTTSGTYTGTTTSTSYSDGIIEAVVDGLSPDTRYYYRLRYRAGGSTADFLAGEEYTFTTQRTKTSTFSFAVMSDDHLGTPDYEGYAFHDSTLYQITMENVAAAQPDFVIDLGDAIYNDWSGENDATVRKRYLDLRSFFQIPGHSAAVFLLPGNHENEEGWWLDNTSSVATSVPVVSANNRKRYFLNPVPDSFYSGNTDPLPEIIGDHLRGDYYAFEWGNALFVAIDPYWYTTIKPWPDDMGGEVSPEGEPIGTRWDWTLGEQQYAWLKQTLEKSSAPLKFVFSHQLVGGVEDYGHGGAKAAKYCEMGGYDTDGKTNSWSTKRPGWDVPIHQLFVKNHVTAFFHGHDHGYAKEALDGVVYQEVPMPADPAYTTGGFTNPGWYAGATIIANSGYLRVTVAGASTTVEYIRSYLTPEDGANNSVAASYTVPGYTP
jgi:hypothetical protein